MIKIKKDKRKISLNFSKHDLKKLEDDQIIFEDENYLINKRKLDNFKSSFPNYYHQLNNIKNDQLLVELNKNPEIVKPRVIKFNDSKKLLKLRYKSNEVITPYLLRSSFSQELVLKTWQETGVDWLKKDNSKILADDMGLGKTLQSIKAASDLILDGKLGTTIIVCTSTLVDNWVSEISKWAPFMTTLVLLETSSKREEIWNKIYGKSHFVITNYEQLRKLPNALKDNELSLIIADEAHKLRKKSSLVHKSFRKLNYKKFWGLTGTPIERDNEDLVSLIKIIDPSTNESSLKRYSNAIIRSKLKKYVLRRLKKDHLKELKDLDTHIHRIELTDKQRLAYERCIFNSKKDSTDTLKTFNKLKEICDVDIESGQSSKIDFILDLMEKIIMRDEKGIIFSFWIEPLKILLKRANKSLESKSYLFTGDQTLEERKTVIDNFKNESKSSFLLCSGKIASEGLNLTEANHVIFLNLWWNPSTNNQALARVDRMGQKKEVFEYKIFTKDSIEEDQERILKNKVKLNDEIIEKIVLKESNK